jgi:hypothetical protein
MKRNFTRICWALSVFVIWLSSTEGQTLDEQLMGTGYEPVINCDRKTTVGDADKRIQLVWMDPLGAARNSLGDQPQPGSGQ